MTQSCSVFLLIFVKIASVGSLILHFSTEKFKWSGQEREPEAEVRDLKLVSAFLV
jgi:hypothetical protein